MLKKLKSYFSDQSFRFAPIIKDIFVAIENKKHKKDVKIYPHLYPSYNFQGKIKGSYLIGCTSGLLLLTNNQIHCISPYFTYGISKHNNSWYVFQKTGYYGRIISFKFRTLNINKIIFESQKLVWTGLSPGVHQIDFWDQSLYLTDTNNNRIMIITKNKKDFFYPKDKGSKKTRSLYNNHFNSIFFNNSVMYIVAHNQSTKTNKNSEIHTFNVSENKHYSFRSIIKTEAKNVHNISLIKNQLFYCDSMAGALVNGEGTVFQDPNYLTRGLSITDKNILLGGSGFSNRENRSYADCIIWCLDLKGNLQSYVKLKGVGQINEIRSIDNDYCLSDTI